MPSRSPALLNFVDKFSRKWDNWYMKIVRNYNSLFVPCSSIELLIMSIPPY